jgi:hypothetical protein
VSLRLTRLRDSEGVIWHVPNGEIKRVGNLSQRRDVGGGEPAGDDDPADDDPAGVGGPDVDPGESGAGPPSDRL